MLPRHLSWLMSPVWVSHVLNINESRPTNLWVTPRIRMRAVCNATQLQFSRLIPVPHMSENPHIHTSFPTYLYIHEWVTAIWEWVPYAMLRNVTESSGLIHVPRMTESATRMNDHVPQICELRYTTEKSRMQWTVNVRLTHLSVNTNISHLQIVF